MAIGTIIRILLGLTILLLPLIMVYFTGDNRNWIFAIYYLIIPFINLWESCCDCKGCIISSYCEIEKKVNFVKNIMIFIGYNKENINSICVNKSDFIKKSYIEIYKIIKDKYKLNFENYTKN